MPCLPFHCCCPCTTCLIIIFVSSCLQGFHKVPGIGYDWSTGKGVPFRYFTFGTACSAVEVRSFVIVLPESVLSHNCLLSSACVLDLALCCYIVSYRPIMQ